MRVSTAMQVETGTSLETQELVCLRKAAELGVQVVKICEDKGVSGALYLSRAGIQDALNLIETGQAHYLIVAKLDRAGRDVDDLRDIRKRVNKYGELVFADGQTYDKNAVGNFLYTIQGAVAEQEKATIAERLGTGRRRRAEQGIMPCRSTTAYGYYVPRHNDAIRGHKTLKNGVIVTITSAEVGKYFVYAPDARYVSDIYRLYASGSSLRAIAKYLQDDCQQPAPGGGLNWYASAVRVILENPVYKGMAKWGKTETIIDETRKTVRNLKQSSITVMRKSTENCVEIPCPAIVDVDRWELCQHLLRTNQQTKSGNPNRTYLLSSLILCPICAGKMHGITQDDCQTYVCRHLTKKTSVHAQKRVDAPSVLYKMALTDDLIISGIIQTSQNPKLVRQAIGAYNAHRQAIVNAGSSDADISRILKELALLETEEKVIAKAQIAGIIAGASAETYADLFTNLASQRTRLQKQLSNAQGTQTLSIPLTHASKLASVLSDVETALTSTALTTKEKQTAIQSIIAQITLDVEGTEATIIYRNQTVHHNKLYAW